MKNLSCLFVATLICLLTAGSRLDAAEDTRVYELRTYTAAPGKLADVLARFRDHTVRIFERHGIVNLGYFTPLDAADGAGEKLIYVVSHVSREAAKDSWKAFAADPEWQEVRKASEVNGKIVTKVESVYLKAADYSPPISAGKTSGPRVYELRTYTTPAGGIDALDARFRNHTVGLFSRHGQINVAYFHPIDADKGAGQTLIYFLAYPSRDAAKASWAAFRADPVWVQAKADSEKKAGGSLTTAVKSVYLAPADFSRWK